MQRILIIALTVSTASAAFIAFAFHQQLLERDARIEALTGAARSAEKSASDQTASLKENVARLTAERDRAKSAARSSEPSAPAAAQSPAKPDTAAGDKGILGGFGGFAKMFQSEEGKKMLRSQSTMVVKMQYAEIAKRLNLSPQETDLFMSLLADRQNALTGDAMGMFSETTPDETKLKQIGEKTEASRKEYDEKLKQTLGVDRFTQFQAYEKTIGERAMMTQFEPQFASAGVPLESAQKEQLIEIMNAERLKSAPNAFAAGNSQQNPFSALKDDAAVDRWMEQEQDYQRRVLQSATKTLNPDQINTLQQAFQQTTERQKFGLKMSREMFKGGAAVEGTAIQATPAPR